MAFSLVKNPWEGDLVEELPISSLTVNNGDLLMLNKGATTWSLATSAIECWQLKAVAQQDASSAATVVKATRVQPTQIWKATTTNNSDVTHNGDRMAIGATAALVNNSGSDVDTVVVGFIQRGVVGATTDKTIVGNIIFGSGATQVN